jgi:hypothetical protein
MMHCNKGILATKTGLAKLFFSLWLSGRATDARWIVAICKPFDLAQDGPRENRYRNAVTEFPE